MNTIQPCQAENTYTHTQCSRMLGHPGKCEDAMGYQFTVPAQDTPCGRGPSHVGDCAPSRVTVAGSAVWISDATPEEVDIVESARTTLASARYLERALSVGTGDLRATVTALAASLEEVLEILQPDPVTIVSTSAGK